MKDNTGRTSGVTKQTFFNGEKVMVRRLGDGKEYRAKIAGIAEDGMVKAMIVEIVDPLLESYEFTHCSIIEVCIDKEPW